MDHSNKKRRLEVDNRKELPTTLTVKEVAELLRVNLKTVYAAVDDGAIPGVVRIRGIIRFSEERVLRWVHDQEGVSPAQNKAV